MHRRVNILQYVRTDAGWQWFSIPKNPRTGNYIWSKTQSDHFYIVWREEKQRRYQKAGSTPSDALNAKRRKEFELAGRAFLTHGRKAERIEKDGITVDAAVEDFLEFVKNKRRPNTLKRYRAVMAHFRKFFKPGTVLATITSADIDSYRDERLKETNPWKKPITARNVNYEVETIRALFYYLRRFRDSELKNPAAGLRGLPVTKTIVDSYEEGELKKLFKVCTKEERGVFKTFYFTGLRDQELATLYWSDLDFTKRILKVRAKPQLSFVPKDWEEREIPIHLELHKIFARLKRRHQELVFPTSKGAPNAHFLQMLKRIVKRGKISGKWNLHKFRRTFATRALERGADIRTVQVLLGHKDITTTAVYLSTSTDRMRDAVSKL